MGILEALISEDYELTGDGRWYKGVIHDSLVVDSEKQIFYWNSKGIVGNAFIWLTQVRGLSYTEAKNILRNYNDYSDTFIHVVKGKKEDIIIYPELVDIFWKNGKVNDDTYWKKRTITDETIDRFKLGYYNGWYMIPIYQDGIFKNFQCRRDDPKKMIKSWYKGVGTLLFNSDILKITDKIYITEGPTDCIVMNQNGLFSVSQNGGSENWQEEWFKYFIYQKEIVVLYDNDDAGRLGVIKVAKNLGIYRTKVYTFQDFSDKGFDVGDFFERGGTRDELLNIIDTKAKRIFE